MGAVELTAWAWAWSVRVRCAVFGEHVARVWSWQDGEVGVQLETCRCDIVCRRIAGTWGGCLMCSRLRGYGSPVNPERGTCTEGVQLECGGQDSRRREQTRRWHLE
ncbi:uncharacterized protein [Physcomitrium patens]|uniref:uncharacterized protein n=1 Tax=Physcomitrium patens TaxID=3218 RepID=UPI003CCDBBE3